jgi:hypothetical protein
MPPRTPFVARKTTGPPRRRRDADAIAAVHRKLNGQLEVRLKARPETLPVSEACAWRFRQL